VRQLNEAARQNDPEKNGINIRIGMTPIARSDLPIDANSTVFNVAINLPFGLTNITLGSALDAIVLNASRPIQYSVLDDGIVFSLKNDQELFTRTYKVDTNIFFTNLRRMTKLPANVPIWPEAITNYFASIGVDFQLPSKSIFYNERLGVLFVRATESDLDTIERAISALDAVAPLIHIKARFFEVPKGTAASFGSFLVSTNSATNQLMGTLNATNLNFILHSLESRKGVETLAEPEVITMSGRQTQMRATTLITVITNFAFQKTATNSSIVPQADQVETGPILDVVPNVLSDDYTINLTVTASLIGFWGYDKPPVEHIPKGDTSIHLPVILPCFYVQQASANLNMRDGQTVILGGLKKHFTVNDKEFAEKPDEIRFTVNGNGVTEKSDESANEMFVFITATIVDPAGNRVHSDDEMTFAKTGVPPQPNH
jgi:type II secretory pathway component GspD/PulD (secretin)